VHVGRAEAVFSLRRELSLLEWQWYLPKTAGNALEYAWLVALENESQVYRLGFSLFKPPGASPRKGSLADLLRAGQVDIWKTRDQKLELVDGARAEVSLSADRLPLIVRDEKTLQLLFSEKPERAVLHVLRAGEPEVATATVIRYDWEPQ
jgi:hypothetical protein